MMAWLKTHLKWLIAGNELEELHRWRTFWHQTDQWFAEFPTAEAALRYLEAKAKGTYTQDIAEIRNNHRVKVNQKFQDTDLFGHLVTLRKCAVHIAYDNGMINAGTTEDAVLHEMYLSLVYGATVDQIKEAEQHLATRSDDDLYEICCGEDLHRKGCKKTALTCLNIMFGEEL